MDVGTLLGIAALIQERAHIMELLVALVVGWDTLVGVVFAHFAALVVRMVRRSQGHWWFWPAAVGGALVIVIALAAAAVVSGSVG
jgi:hypothetical protein